MEQQSTPFINSLPNDIDHDLGACALRNQTHDTHLYRYRTLKLPHRQAVNQRVKHHHKLRAKYKILSHLAMVI